MTVETILLLIDAGINLGLGLVLMPFPSWLIRALGLPEAVPTFYARILGAVLFGIGLALLFEAYPGLTGAGGLSLHGAVAINLCGATMLVLTLLFARLEMPFRGRLVLWTLVCVLVGLSLVEIWMLSNAAPL